MSPRRRSHIEMIQAQTIDDISLHSLNCLIISSEIATIEKKLYERLSPLTCPLLEGLRHPLQALLVFDETERETGELSQAPLVWEKGEETSSRERRMPAQEHAAESPVEAHAIEF